MRLGTAAIVAIAIFGSATPASAEGDAKDASRAAFRRGVSLLQAKDFEGAEAAFREAYDHFPHPSILLNLGVARSHTGAWVQAERDLTRFLTDDAGAPADEVETARSTLAKVRAHLGTLRVVVTPSAASATLDGAPLALAAGQPTEVRVTVGPHVVVVTSDGAEKQRRTAAVAAGATATLTIALPSGATPEASARLPLGIALVGGGVVVAGAGAVLGVRALRAADDYSTPGRPGFQDPSIRSAGITERTLADVAFGVALVSAGAGAYFIATAPRSRVAVSLSPFGAAIAGTF